MRAIVDSPEFFARENFQTKIKNPLEFVTSALRVTGSEAQVTHQLLRYLGRMDRWPEIYKLNKSIIGHNPNCLRTGLRLKIPPK